MSLLPAVILWLEFTFYFKKSTPDQTWKVSCEIAHHRKSSISSFQDIFARADNIFIPEGGLGNNSMEFEDFSDIS